MGYSDQALGDCGQLKQILGFNAVSGNKFSLKQTAEVLSKISNVEVLTEQIKELHDVGSLTIHRSEKDQKYDSGNYNNSLVVRTEHTRGPDARFIDHLAWIEYDDLCKLVSTTNTNKLSLDEKEILDLLKKSDTFKRLVKAVVDFPVVEEFKDKNKPLSAYRDFLEEKGIVTNDREKQVFGAVVREVFNFGKQPKG